MDFTLATLGGREIDNSLTGCDSRESEIEMMNDMYQNIAIAIDRKFIWRERTR